MKDPGPQLGQLVPDGELRRDAIHIAVAPVTACCDLDPGDGVGLIGPPGDTELAGPVGSNNIGIVDPFLSERVKAGERFWMFLFPNTITGLRHIWTHPAFSSAVKRRKTNE